MEERGSGFEWRAGRRIPWRELTFRQDPAGSPGGQHANRSATRVALLWRPASSGAFTSGERDRILSFLGARLGGDGVLRLRCGEHRSAARNRAACLEVLARLLEDALRPRRRRIATRPTASSRERRVQQKRHRSRIKKQRRPPGGATDDERGG